jgi:hypothetical protein
VPRVWPGPYPAKAFIWLNDEAETAAKIAAEQAAGRVGPSTEVLLIRWLPDGSETALPTTGDVRK